MNRTERAEMVKAMDVIVRNLNDEDFITDWLYLGVADGETEFDNDGYVDDEHFPELMQTFAVILKSALTDEENVKGTFYCDGIINERK